MKKEWPIKYPVGTKVVIKRITEMSPDGVEREIESWAKDAIGKTVKVVSRPFHSTGRIEVEIKIHSSRYHAWLSPECFEEINTEARTNLINRIKERSGK